MDIFRNAISFIFSVHIEKQIFLCFYSVIHSLPHLFLFIGTLVLAIFFLPLRWSNSLPPHFFFAHRFLLLTSICTHILIWQYFLRDIFTHTSMQIYYSTFTDTNVSESICTSKNTLKYTNFLLLRHMQMYVFMYMSNCNFVDWHKNTLLYLVTS